MSERKSGKTPTRNESARPPMVAGCQEGVGNAALFNTDRLDPSRLSPSLSVGTRKMVIYACAG